jgi:hypothetical protein
MELQHLIIQSVTIVVCLFLFEKEYSKNHFIWSNLYGAHNGLFGLYCKQSASIHSTTNHRVAPVLVD